MNNTALQMEIEDLRMEIARLEMELNFHLENWDSPEWYIGHEYNHYGFDSYTKWYEDEINTLYDELARLEQNAVA